MARWQSCNVLSTGSDARQLWQFGGGQDKFALNRAERKLPGEPLPPSLIAKDWQTLLQPRLNVAWLPLDKAFFRVVQLPKADLSETLAMVELQLEKISPLPVTQIVWSFDVLPNTDPALQTVIVTVASRDHVEAFLGDLEGQQYLADRIELPFIDQLRATPITSDGVWIYPGIGKGIWLVAWWYGRTLENLSMVHLPATENWAQALRDQLSQITWAGELEGWITSPPRYHLVVDPVNASIFEEKLRDALQQPIEIVPPMPDVELAALTARRAAIGDPRNSLLPVEFAARYRQRFIDRIWMRTVFALILLYVAGVAVYGGLVFFARLQYNNVNDEITSLGGSYTNALQLKSRVQVMRDQVELQYAALECWKASAELMPTELTLDSMNFDRGRKLTLYGTAATEDGLKVTEYTETLARFKVNGQPLFTKVNPPNVAPKPGAQMISWNFSCDLKRTDNE